MVDDTKAALARLDELLGSAKRSFDRESLAQWQCEVEDTLTKLFGADSVQVRRFNAVNLVLPASSSPYWPSEMKAFNSQLERASGVMRAALSAARDRSRDEAARSSDKAADSKGDPGRNSDQIAHASLRELAVSELNRLPRKVKLTVLITALLLGTIYTVWLALPDTVRVKLFASLSMDEQKPQELVVGPGAPQVAFGGQVVVLARNLSRGTAEIRVNFERTGLWHRLTVGDQYSFIYRGERYILTLLQASGEQAKIVIAVEK